MQKFLGVVVVENRDGRVQRPIEFFIQAGHDEGADVLVMDAFDDAVFEGVAERSVPNVMEQNGGTRSFRFRIADLGSLGPQHRYGLLHEVEGSDGVVKAVVHGPGVDQVGKPELADPSQTLNVGVVHEVKTQRVLNGDEPVNRIVQDFMFVVIRHELRAYELPCWCVYSPRKLTCRKR